MNNIVLQAEKSEVISILFPKEVTGVILPIDDYLSQLSPDEYKIIKSASDKRKLEFSTGRWCAKQALTTEGVKHFPILSGENREPIWPENIVGSISHCKDLCGAAVTQSSNINAIGFDIENLKELKNDIARIVFTKEEKSWASKTYQYPHNTLALLIFSLKEAVYKNVYHHKKVKLGFKDCRIIPNFDNNSADIIFYKNNIEQGISLRFIISDNHIFSSAISYSSDRSDII